MKQIITYKDLCSRYAGQFKGYKFDELSRQIVVNWMKQYYHQFNIASVTLTEGNNCADLIVTLTDGKRIAIECKDRQFSSTQYGDQVVEDVKINALRKHIAAGEYHRAHLITLFSDGVMAIAPDIHLEHKDAYIQSSICNKQTMVDVNNREKTQKNLVHFPLALKYYFAFSMDENDSQASIIFSTEPLKFDKLTTEINSNALF